MPERVGEYEVVRELGRGGMGVVYEGRHPRLEHRVAIKVLLDPLADEAFLQRFLREGQVCARLDHPNLVRVFDAGRAGGRPYLVMAFVEGESLADRLQADGPLEPREAARLTALIARALGYAHEQGVLHRDLKPANVILRGDQPLLADFGLARDAQRERERLTRTGEMLGTPSYMSPEQANGDVDAVDPRTDVYGLGATLYALLSGRPPFQAGSQIATIKQVLLDPPPPLGAGVPRELAAIVQRCLAKEPEARFGSAFELADALERVRAAPAPRARSYRLPLTAVVAAGLGVGLTLAVVSQRPEPSSTAEPPAPPTAAAAPLPSASPADAPPSAKQALERARAALERADWEAVHLALKDVPEDEAPAWLLRGRAHLLRYLYQSDGSQLDLAARAFQRAEDLAPSTETAGWLGHAQRHQPKDARWREAARRAVARGRGAWAHFAAGLLQYADSTRASGALRASQLRETVIPRIARAVEADPGLVVARTELLGIWQEVYELHRTPERWAEADRVHQQAGSASPDDPRVLMHVGGLYKKEGERLYRGKPARPKAAARLFRQALGYLRRSVRADDRFLSGAIELAFTRAMLAQCDPRFDPAKLRASARYLERAGPKFPYHDHAYLVLGFVYVALRDSPSAIRAFRESVARKSDNPVARDFLRRLGAE